MKKLWMFLAAVGSLAACDDKLGDDQQTAQDPVIVNVSATSALDYQWQATDAVRLSLMLRHQRNLLWSLVQ